MKHLGIIAAFIGCSILSIAQNKYPIHTFYKHSQICNFVGTTEDFVTFDLYSDSSFELNRYSSNYKDHYNSVTNSKMTGSWTRVNDTIILTYYLFTQVSQPQNDLSKSGKNYQIKPGCYKNENDNKYILTKNSINTYPENYLYLPEGKISESLSLKNAFTNWKGNDPASPHIFGVNN